MLALRAKIIPGSKRLASKAMYDETNRQIEKWTEIIDVAVVKVTPVCGIAPKIILCYFLYFTTELGNDAFELSLAIWYTENAHVFQRGFFQASCLCIFNLRLPFDEKKPITYFIVVTYQFIEAVYTLVLCACILSFGIGVYMFLFSVIEDIKRDLILINELAKAQRNQLQMAFKELFNVLQLHSDSKQCVISFP